MPRNENVFTQLVTNEDKIAFQTLESEGEWIQAENVLHLEDMR